ncbi:hypothetical protein ACFSTC_33105 [Nonomuraea ferruginea]
MTGSSGGADGRAAARGSPGSARTATVTAIMVTTTTAAAANAMTLRRLR